MSIGWNLPGSVGKMIPGTHQGWKGAQPTPRQYPQRPPGADTHDSSPPCACNAFSDGDAGPLTSAVFEEIPDLCANNADLSVTNDPAWATDGFYSHSIRLDFAVDAFSGGVFIYRAVVAQENPSVTTASYLLELLPGPVWSHTLTGQPVLGAGDTVELVLAGLMSGTVAAAMKINGSTVLSDSSAAPDAAYETMTARLVAQVIGLGIGENPGTVSDWAAAGTC